MPPKNDHGRAAEDFSSAARDIGSATRDIARELRATTRLVQEAAQMGKSELLHYLGESVDPLRRRAESFSAGQGREREPRQRTSRPAPQSAARPFKPVTRGRWALFCVGAPFLLAGAICNSVYAGQMMFYGFPSPPLLIVGTFLSSIGAGLMVGSAVRRILGRRYSRIRSLVGDKTSVGICSLKDRLSYTRRRLERYLEDMVERGYFGGDARLDLERELLVIDPVRLAEEERRAQQDAEAAAQKEEGRDEYEEMLQTLRELNERIEDDEMSERIYRIEAVTRATFAAVKEKPEKKAQLRRFMDYYLPTAIKLLDAYAGFERQKSPGENVRKSMKSIEDMTATMAEAFERQFDSLFLTESMDIGAEVRTMDTLLRQDGLIGGFRTSSGGGFAKQETK